LELSGDFRQVEEIFRRLAFNIIAGNCDDHAKNAAFLLDSRGEWKLSPAFDLTHSPGINRLGAHAMSVCGNRTPGLKDLESFAGSFGVASWREILDEVKGAARNWPHFAGEAGVRAPVVKRLGEEFSEGV
jgi:serine/threonine-protein kinase HipA